MAGGEQAPDERLREALRLLAAVARERLPGGVVPRDLGELELQIRLPVANGGIEAAAARLEEELVEELRAVADARALCAPGHVWCPRCASSTCEHSQPAEPRRVLAGYGITGMPRFLDLGQLLLERQHPRVAELYEERARPVTLVQTWRELAGELLPAFRERFGRLRLHGQVSAGWYPVPGGNGDGRQRAAVSFQVLSTGRGHRRRYVLHPVGAAASAAVLDALHRQHERLPWRDAVRWAEGALQQVETVARRPHPPAPAAIERRLEAILHQLAERLERPFRARERRTAHGEERHRGGRPTPTAIADLREAPRERVLFDARHETYVVLGPRGRTHVFGSGGKLVTSVRYPAATIAKRQKTGAWRTASAEQAAALLRSVEALVNSGGGRAEPAATGAP